MEDPGRGLVVLLRRPPAASVSSDYFEAIGVKPGGLTGQCVRRVLLLSHRGHATAGCQW